MFNNIKKTDDLLNVNRCEFEVNIAKTPVF